MAQGDMKQHFVPAFLLRAWMDPDRDNKLEAFSLHGDRVTSNRRHPNAVGYQLNLVSFERPLPSNLDRHAIERDLFSPHDTRAAEIRVKLMEGGGEVLAPAEQGHWARFLLSLRLRQPPHVQRMREDWPEHLRDELAAAQDDYAAEAEPDDPETFIEWVEANKPEVFVNHGLGVIPELMLAPDKVAKIVELAWWVVDLSESKHDLLIGDDPLIIWPGLDAPQMLLGLPLGPRHAFLASRGAAIERILRYRTNATHVAQWLNERTVAQARERVFAANQKPQRFIENHRGTPSAGR